jgi:hypothetical protein
MTIARAIAVVASGLALASCSSLMSSEMFTAPTTATLTLESNPPCAEARPSTGGACRTPCQLAVPITNGVAVTYALDGYLPETVPVKIIPAARSALIDVTPPTVEPDPVFVQLKEAPPPPPPPPPPKKRQRAQPAAATR